MRSQRGVSTLGAVLLAGTAGMLTATLLMDWMVLDIHVEEDTPIHFKVPFPLILADAASHFIPDHALEEAVVPEELKAQKGLILATVQALLETPDTHFVKVETEDANVDVFKEGDNIRVEVDAEDAVVSCTIPIDGVFDALEDWDWEVFDPEMILTILHSADNGELVNIETEDGVRVAIKMW